MDDSRFNLGNFNFGSPAATTASASSNSFDWNSLGSGLSLLTQGLTSAGSSYAQSQAYEMQGAYQRSISNINTKLADFQAEDTMRRADVDIYKLRDQTKKLIGSQRVALAGQGINIDSGSALKIQEDTAFQSAMDVIKLKNNAWREAFGYKISSLQSSAAGQYASSATSLLANNSILTGGLTGFNYGLKAGFASKDLFK